MWRALGVVVVVLVAGATLGANVIGAGLSCAFDTSYCAESTTAGGLYRGRLFTAEMEAANRAKFQYKGESGLSEDFSTDEQGRFCLLMPSEAVTPYITAEPFSGSPPSDDRLEGYPELLEMVEGNSGPILVHPGPQTEYQDRSIGLNGGPNLGGGGAWLDGTDDADVCQTTTARGPWYRHDDHTSSWQYLTLIFVPAGSWVLLLVAWGVGGVWASQLRTGGIVLALVSPALFAVLWSLAPSTPAFGGTTNVANPALPPGVERLEDRPLGAGELEERARSRTKARRTADAIDRCYRSTRDYRQCNSSAELGGIPISGRLGEARITFSTRDVYTVDVVSTTGNIRISRTRGLPREETCSSNSTGSC